MRRKLLAVTFVVAAATMFAAFATSASARPAYTSPCTNCHTGVNVPVTATLASTTGTNATYNVSAPSATAIVVFNGSTKLATITGTSGSFVVPVGGTYTIYAVKGPSDTTGIGSTSVSPVAAPSVVDTIAPVTTSDAKATYAGSATIKLTATDNVAVAHTYYVLDGGTQVEGTSVTSSVVGTHTLEFWSVDTSANAEAHNTVSFTVTAAVPAPTATIKCSVRTVRVKHALRLSGVVTPASAGTRSALYVKRPGSSKWVLLSRPVTAASGAWSYKYTPAKRGTYSFRVRYTATSGTVVSRTVKVTSK
jgi:hypothetical protein